MSQQWTTNSDLTLEAFISNARKLYAEHKYLTWSMPRIGADRSMGQNGLFQKWARVWAAEILNVRESEVPDGAHEGMKRDLKKMYYNMYGQKWMICRVEGPLSGGKKIDYSSSSKWSRGEAFDFLTWMQMAAASSGVILESQGQFNKLQRDQI